jgi:hypothetical protein
MPTTSNFRDAYSLRPIGSPIGQMPLGFQARAFLLSPLYSIDPMVNRYLVRWLLPKSIRKAVFKTAASKCSVSGSNIQPLRYSHPWLRFFTGTNSRRHRWTLFNMMVTEDPTAVAEIAQ